MSSDKDRVKLYAQIPDDTDVLITHGPPFGILDQAPGSDDHQGCRALFDRVRQLKPKLHVFGHIHGAHGTFRTEDTLFVNAALLGSGGNIDNSPIVVRLPRI